MNELKLSYDFDLGYTFYPPEVPEHPGHPGMDVVLHEVPTYQHFDPLKVSYLVASQSRGVNKLVVCHPWSGGRQFRVCAGRIILIDRVGKMVEAFTLGGDLQIDCTGDRTVCSLISPAPIFHLFSVMDLPMCLTAEMEIFLAQQKAHWDSAHPHAFEEHLAKVDPFELYACFLQEMHKKGKDLHSGSESLDCDAQHFILDEISRLKENGRWPQRVRRLDELFGAV